MGIITPARRELMSLVKPLPIASTASALKMYHSSPGNINAPFTFAANTLYKVPVLIYKTTVITQVSAWCYVAIAASACRLGLRRLRSDHVPSTLVADFGEITTTSTGEKTITGLSVPVAPGAYVLEMVSNNAIALGGVAHPPLHFGYFGAGVVAASYILRSFAYGPLPADETASLYNSGFTTCPTFGLYGT